MDNALVKLIKISKIFGKDNSLVQGGGGNTSVKTKDGKYMYIKASGTALKDMNRQRGWRRLKMDSVLAILNDKSIDKLNALEREFKIVNQLNLSCDDSVKLVSRPSVESHFHALLDRYVVHLHPVAIGAYVCAREGKTQLERLFKNEEFPPLWIPYTDPGYTLAAKIDRLVDDCKNRYGRKPSIIFLEKHGLVVSADTSDKVLQLVRRVIKICNSKLKNQKIIQTKKIKEEKIIAVKCNIRRAFSEVTGQEIMVKHFIDINITKFLTRKDAKKLIRLPALTPDELVYANGSAIWLEEWDCKKIKDELNRKIAMGEKIPAGFLIKDLGLFIAGKEKSISTTKEVIVASLLIRSLAANFGGVNPLNSRERQFIIQWEAESFRQKLAR